MGEFGNNESDDTTTSKRLVGRKALCYADIPKSRDLASFTARLSRQRIYQPSSNDFQT